MIYIFTLAVLIVLVIRFDYKYVGKNRNNFDNHTLTRYDFWYRVMLIWFICVSGFAYNVGSDIPIYMREYNNFGGIWKVNTFSDILKFDNRQPGWVLLNVICASISRNFVLLKLVIAIFVNWTVFRFLRRHTQYVFTGIFFYAVILYLSLNFNALRQSIAVGFFLIGYDYLLNKQLSKYFLFAFFSYMFHSSGIICFMIPLLNYVRFTKRFLLIFGALLIVVTFYVLQSEVLQSLINAFIISGYGGDSITAVAADHMKFADDRVGALNFFGILMVIFNICVVLSVILFNIRKGKEISTLIPMITVYTVFYTVSFAIPIIFERFLYFFFPFYICAIANTVVEFPKIFKGMRLFLTAIIVSFFCYTHISNLLSENAASGIPLINQFAPYYSVFNPQIDPIRASNFGYCK